MTGPDAPATTCDICGSGDGQRHDLVTHAAAGTFDTRSRSPVRGVVVTDSPDEPFPATYETRP